MWSEWFTAPPSTYLYVALSCAVVYLCIVLYTRIFGLRSFSKISATDFAMTVAVGSLFASSIATSSPPLPLALVALGCLFGGQWFFAFLRRKSPQAGAVLDNRPVLLMRGREFLEGNMKRTNVTHADILAKLREANVLSLSQIRAVVFETTGDISVLHCAGGEALDEEELLRGVEQ